MIVINTWGASIRPAPVLAYPPTQTVTEWTGGGRTRHAGDTNLGRRGVTRCCGHLGFSGGVVSRSAASIEPQVASTYRPTRRAILKMLGAGFAPRSAATPNQPGRRRKGWRLWTLSSLGPSSQLGDSLPRGLLAEIKQRAPGAEFGHGAGAVPLCRRLVAALRRPGPLACTRIGCKAGSYKQFGDLIPHFPQKFYQRVTDRDNSLSCRPLLPDIQPLC